MASDEQESRFLANLVNDLPFAAGDARLILVWSVVGALVSAKVELGFFKQL